LVSIFANKTDCSVCLYKKQGKEPILTNLQASRTRTITWEDPTAAVQTGKSISGMAYLKALQSGELPPPPIAVLLGMSITEVSEGRVVFVAEPSEYHYNPLGTVHGGVMATLLDSALGCVVQSMLPAGTSYTTLELKVNYLRPVTVKTGTIYAEGKIIYVGGRIATAEGRLTDAAGKLYAHGTTTCIIMRPSSLNGSGQQ
jgi:uncharacterized protein (TIGR00369 family)